MQRVHIRAAIESDMPKALEMLGFADLPTQDLSIRHLAVVAESAAGVAGFIGLESFGEIGLLRSLVVSPKERGGGIGRLLVRSLESLARDRGISELWLLTVDADQFFSKLDYEVRQREFVPEDIRGSQEFSALCPADAILMSRSLLR
jgi:amino-acid N-acetyltransferase